MKRTYCDRCGNYIVPDIESFSQVAIRKLPNDEVKGYDLCASCAYKLKKFIEENAQLSGYHG